MPTVQSWEVSDALWSRVEPLLPRRNPRTEPRRKYRRRPGGGRKPISPRAIFAAIVYVLRTGCQWKALPKSFGSASAIHQYFQQWRQEGFFVRLWRAGLAEYDDMAGIAWEWQSLDGTQGKAPLAQEAVGNNPTDREKKRDQAQSAGGRPWRPALAYRRRGQSARREVAGADTGRDRGSTA
jgi:transposase